MVNKANITLYPLTHPQKRIWYIEKIYPDTSMYNIGGYMRIKGEADFSLLERTLNILLKKNEALRLRFLEEGGEIKQYVSPYREEKIDFFDFSREANPEEAFKAWVQQTVSKVFDFEKGPFYYYALFKIDEKNCGALGKVHHIISDGWSFNITLDHICETYNKLLKGEAVNEEVENSYIDYIEQEQKYLASDRFLKNKAFWNEKFQTLPENLLDRIPERMEGRRKTYFLNAEKSAKIKAFVTQNKYSLNTFFVTLFMIYLHKTTQKEDITIGSPVLNRSGKKERSIYGMFTSTMPFRLAVEGHMSAAALMEQVNNELMSCYFNQKYPYDILAQDLELKKKGYEGLFQICVNYYNSKFNREIGGVEAECIEVYTGHQSYALQLVVREWSDYGVIALDLDYNIEHYVEAEADCIFDCLDKLATQVSENPEETLERLDLLSQGEKERLLYGLNTTEADYPKDKTICELIEAQVEKNPHKIALTFEDESLTYKALNTRANQLGAYLRQIGVSTGTVVGIMAHHSMEMVVGILAVIKAGGAYLPIDPAYPSDRVAYMLEDSGTTLLLVNGDIKPDMDYKGEILNLEDESLYIGQGDNLPQRLSGPKDLVYIIYTSGSTGKPKGVMIEHQGLVNYIWWAKKNYLPDSDAVFALHSSLAFDLTVTSIFAPLIGGNSIAIYRDTGDEFVLYRMMRENKATVIKLTPAHLSLIKDMDNRNSSIRRFIVGGEDLKVSLAAAVHKSFGGNVEILNEYGPTETVVGCMIHQYDFEKDTAVSVPIGVPADNVQLYILDKNAKPLPMGSIGELYVSGDGVARGYLNRLELTDERFLDNPFLDGKRMYKTGDLAKYLPDGKLVYAGRADQQVKIRGYRIELGEIERHIASVEGVKDAVVIDREDASRGKYLCAYIVSEGTMDTSTIKSHLLKFLPNYMIPACFVRLDTIPLTQNGKVNRRLLPEPDVSADGEIEYVAAVGEKEEKLVDILQKVLGMEKIGLKDDFYSMGGDSIKAIQISAKLHDAGYKIRVKDILSHSVIQEMALCLEEETASLVIDQNPCEGRVLSMPITDWFFEQNFKNPGYYNQSVLLTLKGHIDAEGVASVIHQLIKHHDAFRLNYDPVDKTLYYNAEHLTKAHKVPQYDLSQYPPCEQDIRMIQGAEAVKASIDIEKDVLLKACLFDLGVRGKRLLLTANHLAVDGISWRILLEDMAILFEQIKNKEPLALPQKTHSVQRWAEKLHEYSQGALLEEAGFWQSMLQENFEFPVDFDRGEDTIDSCGTVKGWLEKAEIQELWEKAFDIYNIDMKDLLIVALTRTLKDFTKKEAVTIELEGHGREALFEDTDISRTVGWFTSMYPVNLKIEAEDLDGYIKSVKEQLRKIPQKGIGFGILKYLSKAFGSPASKPIRFNYLGDFGGGFANEFFEPTLEDSGRDWDKANALTALLDINAVMVHGKLEISLLYSKNKFKEETVEGFMKSFMDNIRLIASYCSEKESIEFTPSDFDTVELSQEDLEDLFD